MRTWRSLALFMLCLAAGLLADAGHAREIYRWVDENGVVNFSDDPPPTDAAEARSITLEDTGSDEAVDEDPFNIEATAERMQAYRDELAQRRESQRAARLERERIAAQRPAVQYQRSGYVYPWYRPPYRPIPPIEPQPPTPEPYTTVPFLPPGGGRN